MKILADNANRAIQGNVAMQVTQFNLVGKFVINACGAIWWPNLQLMQMAPSGGQISSWSLQPVDVTQVKESIPWVRYATANVFSTSVNIA